MWLQVEMVSLGYRPSFLQLHAEFHNHLFWLDACRPLWWWLCLVHLAAFSFNHKGHQRACNVQKLLQLLDFTVYKPSGGKEHFSPQHNSLPPALSSWIFRTWKWVKNRVCNFPACAQSTTTGSIYMGLSSVTIEIDPGLNWVSRVNLRLLMGAL